MNVVDEIFSNSYVIHSGGRDLKGHEFIKRFAKQLRSAIPDIKILRIEFLIRRPRGKTNGRTNEGPMKDQ